MKGYRFFAEMPEARKSKSASKANPFFPWTVKALAQKSAEGFTATCIAVYLDEFGRPIYSGDGCLEGMSVAIDSNHYSYSTNGMSREYLAKRCTRIPESLARKLSPQLFQRLES